MITPKYSVEVISRDTGNVSQAVIVGKYKEARRFIMEHPITEGNEQYRVMRTDYLDDEEINTKCVYEQGVSTYIEEWEE